MIAIILKNPTLRLIAVILWTAIVAGAGSAYPFLNPANFNALGALAAFILTAVAVLVAHIYVGHTQASIRVVEGSLVRGTQQRIPPDPPQPTGPMPTPPYGRG